MSLPAITVKQPGASLIMHGFKPLENRGKAWPRTIKLPCEVLVVAGKGQWSHDVNDHQKRALIASVGNDDAAVKMLSTRLGRLPAGAALGTVWVTACVTDSTSPWAMPGQHHYLLADPQPFAEPIPFPASRLGIFQAPTVEALRRPHDGKTRRVDAREELADVMITRPGPWGNPYRVRKIGPSWWVVRGKGDDERLISGPWSGQKLASEKACLIFRNNWGTRNPELISRLCELKGLRLGCFCRADEPCHGDVLVNLVKEVCGD